jgi:hypothetical protein
LHKEYTESLIDASKEIREEINPEKYKCMLISRHHIAGENNKVKIAKGFFYNVAHNSYIWEQQ